MPIDATPFESKRGQQRQLGRRQSQFTDIRATATFAAVTTCATVEKRMTIDSAATTRGQGK